MKVKLDEATGKILGFSPDDPLEVEELLELMQFAVDCDDVEALDARLAKTDPTMAAVAFAFIQELAGEHFVRWQVEGDQVLTTRIT